MKKIRLSKADHKRYDGLCEYIIAYNYNAGLPNRYNVYLLNSEDPVVIGRELPLDTVRELIKDYERFAKKLPCWIGEREDALLLLSQVKEYRLKKFCGE